MKLEIGFLRSQVARRVFGFFILSALVPIIAIAVLSFTHVNTLLTEQSRAQLHHASKTYGMDLYDRLLFAEARIREIAFVLRSDKDPTNNLYDRLTKNYFTAVAMINKAGEVLQLRGNMNHLPLLIPPAAKDHFESGEPVLFTNNLSLNQRPSVVLSRVLDPKQPSRGVLVAELNSDYLWGNETALPYMVDICIFDGSFSMLFCSRPVLESLPRQLEAKMVESSTGQLEWIYQDEKYLGDYWEIFLKPKFSVPGWIVLASQRASQALAPIAVFKAVFLQVIVLSVVVVLFLSITQIRRSLIPLEQLIAGTRRIANKDFDSRVQISSGDEFEELGMSLNVMTARLGRQFNALSTLSDVDRLILSAQGVEPIIEIILGRLRDIVPCDFVSVTIIDRDAPYMARIYTKGQSDVEALAVERIVLTPEEMQTLMVDPKGFLLVSGDVNKSYLVPLQRLYARSFLVLPITVKETLSGVKTLSGIIILCYREQPFVDTEDLHQARDFADRIAVALSSAQREEQLYYQAYYDNLTGLPNRQLFKDRLAQELGHAQREGRPLALLFIDLDRFKMVNDSLGHSAGDRLLQIAAERLQRSIRSTDTLARLGGDEFVAVLPQLVSPRDAGIAAHQLIRLLSEPFVMDRHESFVSASIGIALYPTDGMTGEELLKNADTAMYRAKKNGRQRFLFFEEAMNTETVLRMSLESDLHRALEQQELVLYYQPQLAPDTGQITGAEVLIRWNHPRRGMVPPGLFISVAEDSGLIESIGEWVLSEACRQYVAWQKEEIAPPRISVNVSGRQFKQKGFVDLVKDRLADSNIPPERLELEITESLLMDDVEETIITLKQLHSLGLRLSIDDFGTGYSSLSYLKRFPVHALKIDRSFILDVATDESAAAITEIIIAMARTLKKEVVAEGIETEAQLAFLRERQCDHIQGYYFSCPLPADQFADLMCKHLKGIEQAEFGTSLIASAGTLA